MSDKTSAALACVDGLETRIALGQPLALGQALDACCYDSIRAAARQLDFADGLVPGIDALNQLTQHHAQPIVTASGHAIRFAAQNLDPAALSYEAQIFASGVVPTRPNNIHDLFNALIWLTFPQTKATINGRHIAARGGHSGTGNRGPVQDALTLFDECGVVVVSDQTELLELIAAFQWKELFWKRRDAVKQHMRFFLFGHGLMEQLLNPYVGLTGKALLVNVDMPWLGANTSELLQHIDARSRALIASPSALSQGRDLVPLPLLGIPGWAAENEFESYYDDAQYFRAGRRGPPKRKD